MGEWLKRAAKRPPEQVIGHLSKEIKSLLAQGIDADDIRQGIARWMQRGLHPSTLPSVVNEVMNATGPAPRANGHTPFQAPTDHSAYHHESQRL